MLALIAVAGLFAAGVWLIAGAVWPAPTRLSVALRRLHSSPRRLDHTAVASAGDASGHSVAWLIGTWVMGRAKASALVDDQTAADLRILGRSPEVFAGFAVLSAVTGLLLGPIVWGLAAAAGVRLPFVLPLWLMVVGALAGWFVPKVVLRGEASNARNDFGHALGAYLDVLVLLLAAHEGPESAMDLAARAGAGPAFAELREAVSQARLSGDAVWDRLDDLGARLRVTELREIAAAGALAGESGAAVRRSLTAKARALRSSALSKAETSARKRSQAMFAPLVLMGMGFILFLVFPLITNLSIGGAR